MPIYTVNLNNLVYIVLSQALSMQSANWHLEPPLRLPKNLPRVVTPIKSLRLRYDFRKIFPAEKLHKPNEIIPILIFFDCFF